MNELVCSLGDLNPDAVEPTLLELQEYLLEEAVSPIQQAVERFDFDAALAETRALAQKLDLDLPLP